MIRKFADIPVNDAVRLAITTLDGRAKPYLKDHVTEEVLKQHNIRMMVKVIGGEFPGWQWDKAIESHIQMVAAFELHDRDENDVRRHQCWPSGGKWWWELFAVFDLPKLHHLRRSATTAKRQAELRGERLDIWIAAIEKRGSGTIRDVYAEVLPELKVIASVV